MLFDLPTSMLQEIAGLAATLPNLDGSANLSLEGALQVWHKDGYQIGEFRIDESYWLFRGLEGS